MPASGAPPTSKQNKKTNEPHVGEHIAVLWPADKQYYPGRVTRSDPNSRKFDVKYDDGESERSLDMTKEKWYYVKTPQAPSSSRQTRTRKSGAHSSGRSQRPHRAAADQAAALLTASLDNASGSGSVGGSSSSGPASRTTRSRRKEDNSSDTEKKAKASKRRPAASNAQRNNTALRGVVEKTAAANAIKRSTDGRSRDSGSRATPEPQSKPFNRSALSRKEAHLSQTCKDDNEKELAVATRPGENAQTVSNTAFCRDSRPKGRALIDSAKANGEMNITTDRESQVLDPECHVTSKQSASDEQASSNPRGLDQCDNLTLNSAPKQPESPLMVGRRASAMSATETVAVRKRSHSESVLGTSEKASDELECEEDGLIEIAKPMDEVEKDQRDSDGPPRKFSRVHSTANDVPSLTVFERKNHTSCDGGKRVVADMALLSGNAQEGLTKSLHGEQGQPATGSSNPRLSQDGILSLSNLPLLPSASQADMYKCVQQLVKQMGVVMESVKNIQDGLQTISGTVSSLRPFQGQAESTTNVNHSENAERLDRIENTINRIRSEVPNLISSGFADVSTRLANVVSSVTSSSLRRELHAKNLGHAARTHAPSSRENRIWDSFAREGQSGSGRETHAERPLATYNDSTPQEITHPCTGFPGTGTRESGGNAREGRSHHTSTRADDIDSRHRRRTEEIEVEVGQESEWFSQDLEAGNRVDSTKQAMSLVALNVVIWLLETNHECRTCDRRIWARDTSIKCLDAVADNLAKFSNHEQAFQTLLGSLGRAHLEWILYGPSREHISLARKNYEVWEPPPCDEEWKEEVDLLMEVSHRFRDISKDYRPKYGESVLQIAVSIANLSASLCTGRSEVNPGNVPVNLAQDHKGIRSRHHSETANLANSTVVNVEEPMEMQPSPRGAQRTSLGSDVSAEALQIATRRSDRRTLDDIDSYRPSMNDDQGRPGLDARDGISAERKDISGQGRARKIK